MIAYVKGTLEDVSLHSIVVECKDTGYEILVPQSMIQQLPSIGSAIKIYTHLHVREDAMQLYGFSSKAEKEMFRLLITVSGIGPKGALGILSVFTVQDLQFAIMAGDAKTIAKAPGIGKKTAEKVILELKDKVNFEDALLQLSEHKEDTGTGSSAAMSEAMEALVALGYSKSEATKAIHKAEITENMDTETVLKLALKKIMSL